MTPISDIVNSSQVSSNSDPPLSSDSILVKWRPMTAAGIGSWDQGGHKIIPGGLFVSWLVSILSEEIMGFVVKGLSLVSFLSSPLPHIWRQIPFPQHISSISLNTPPLPPPLEDSHLTAAVVVALSPFLILVSRSPSLPRPFCLGQFARIFPECLTSVSIS
jgi:hypothetical protein